MMGALWIDRDGNRREAARLIYDALGKPRALPSARRSQGTPVTQIWVCVSGASILLRRPISRSHGAHEGHARAPGNTRRTTGWR